MILHFRPRTVPHKTLKFTFTWGLGGMALVLVFLLAGTGILLKFVYQPFPGKAYASIVSLQQKVWFGQSASGSGDLPWPWSGPGRQPVRGPDMKRKG